MVCNTGIGLYVSLSHVSIADMSCPIDVRGRRASLDSFFAIRQDVTAPHALLFYEEDMFPDYFAADIRWVLYYLCRSASD